MKHQKRLFNQLLFLYNKYKRKKQNLAAKGHNIRRQHILDKHLERLHEKLVALYAFIKRTTIATALVTGALAFQPGTAKAQNFLPVQTNPFNLTNNNGNHPSPALADLDNDGDLDMMVGKYDGNFKYFKNIGTASAPSFAAGQTNPFNLTDIGSVSYPAFADLDNDGELDMIAGEHDGDFKYFENTGTASVPSFAAVQNNPFNLTDISLYNSVPAFADLDNDGDLDVVAGEFYGDFKYFERDLNTQLAAASCGSTLTNLSQKLYCKKITGATNYKYKIEHAATSFSTIYTKGTADTNLILFYVAGIQYGKTYTVSVSNFSNGAWSSYGPVCNVTTPTVEPKLNAASCGTTLTNLSQKIYCKKIAGATNYRYKIEHAATSFSTTYIKGIADTSLILFYVNGIEYGKTYTISVSYFSNGLWSPFGTPCNVTTPALEPKLNAASCGATLDNLVSKIYCKKITGATDYRYKIEHAATSFSTTYIKGVADTSLILAYATGIEYGKTYTISVSYYSNGVWSPFGTACNVTTPILEPKLTDASCGATISNLSTQKIYCKKIAVAINYRYKIEHAATSFSTIYTRASADTSMKLSNVQGVVLGKTYTVRVSYLSNGVWSPYGTACNITTIALIQQPLAINENDHQSNSNISIYPNPAMDMITIVGSENFTHFEVVNLLGQTMVQRSNTDKQNNLKINVSELSQGTYFIRLKDDENNFIIRKIVKK